MQIHVVRKGQTLWGISQTYSVPLDTLIRSNEIPNPNNLVVGQSIVIPIYGSYHWVKPGESLYQIGRQYNISTDELMRINGIMNVYQVPIGLRLYIPQKTRRYADVGAYVDLNITGDNSPKVVDKIGEDLTYLSIFSYAINRNGTLTSINDQSTINAAYKDDVLPLMVLTNYEDGTFSQDLATYILTDEALQDKILDEAIKLMKEKGYGGLDFDFEYLGAENKERYNNFLRKAASILKKEGYYISTALAPKTSADQKGTLYEGHDYKSQGEIVDFIFFMTYEWGWSGGPPLPVAPINKVKGIMEYAISEVPKNKIMMGIPLYGYDWTLPYVKGGKFAKAIDHQEAILLAEKYGAEIKYDYVAQSPYFNYVDEAKKSHIVCFEDARSIQAKFDLVKQLGIRGFFYWVLGNEFPQNWLLIEDNFVVRKKV
ncbi:glycosyl hydrolase family 18 protein [Clostridium sp. DL1XJH146]